MSAPVLWIIIPGGAAVLLYFVRRWHRTSILTAILLCLVLSAAASLFPIGRVTTLGPLNIQFTDELSLLGRRLILEDGDRPMLVLVYLLAAFWFGGSYAARSGRIFTSVGLGMVVALIAALAVEPFLYAALLIELAALLGVPLLAAPGQPVPRGVLRFLAFHTIGMPFILFVGWMLEGVETSPGNPALVAQAAGLLGFGFLLLLAVFPFHTWVPMLAGQVHAYAAGFIFVIMPWMVTLFGLGLLDRYAWLRTNPGLPILLQQVGLLMSVTSGIWMAFDRHLGRIMGFAVLAETGFAIMALGFPGGVSLYAIMILPRVLSFGIWSLSLSLLQQKYPQLDYQSVQGAARQMPLVSAALILSQFSLAGMPLLAGFPVRLAVWETAASQSSWTAFWALVAMIGLLASGLRTLAVLVMGTDEQPWKITEIWPANFLLGVGMFITVSAGLFPQLILPALLKIVQTFVHLTP